MPQKVEITPKTIIFTVFLLLGLNVIWTVRELIYALFLAFILMSTLKPIVTTFEKNKVPKTLAAFIVLMSSISIFAFVLFFILPPIINESLILVKNIPMLVLRTIPTFGNFVNTESIVQFFPNLTANVIDFITRIFSNLILIVSVIFFTYYFLLEDNFVEKYLTRFLNKKQQGVLNNIGDKIESRMGSWLFGELVLMSIIGIATYIGLVILGVKYALPLAFLAGLLEVVPIIGPTISAIPAILVASTTSFFLGGVTLLLYFIIQQLENNLVVPLVMKKTVGIHPVVTLIALTVGGKLGGLMGLILSVPAALVVETIILEYLAIKDKKD